MRLDHLLSKEPLLIEAPFMFVECTNWGVAHGWNIDYVAYLFLVLEYCFCFFIETYERGNKNGFG